jgi:hypothetical protein
LLPCLTRADAIFNSPDEKLFIMINSDDLWKYDNKSKNWQRTLSSTVYPELEGGFQGGAQCSKGLTWFINGNQVKAYRKTTLEKSFRIDPANWYDDGTIGSVMSPSLIVNKNNIIYILKKQIAYLLDTTESIIKNRYYLEAVFPHLTSTHIHATYKIDNFIYFIDNEKYFIRF